MHNLWRWIRRGALVSVVPLAALGCHGRHHHRAGMTEAELREHAGDGAEFVLDHVDASEAQEARINQILDGLVPDLYAMKAEREALANELHQALAADPIDPARVEALRKQALGLVDRASARASQALVEAAQVLDKGQRDKLLRHWQRRRGA